MNHEKLDVIFPQESRFALFKKEQMGLRRGVAFYVLIVRRNEHSRFLLPGKRRAVPGDLPKSRSPVYIAQSTIAFLLPLSSFPSSLSFHVGRRSWGKNSRRVSLPARREKVTIRGTRERVSDIKNREPPYTAPRLFFSVSKSLQTRLCCICTGQETPFEVEESGERFRQKASASTWKLELLYMEGLLYYSQRRSSTE